MPSSNHDGITNDATSSWQFTTGRPEHAAISADEPVNALIALWAFKLLDFPVIRSRLLRRYNILSDEVADRLGLESFMEDNDEENGSRKERALKQFRLRKKQVEQAAVGIALPDALKENLNLLATHVQLDKVSTDLLAFAVLYSYDALLREVVQIASECGSLNESKMLALVLECDPGEIALALSRAGRLAQTGLLLKREHGFEFELLSPDFARQMLLDQVDVLDLFYDRLQEAAAPALSVSNFDHLKDHLSVLVPYLQHALTQRSAGVNVLLYGPPGTGKSELALVLAREVGALLYEVVSNNSEGDAIDGSARLRAFRAAQYLLCGQRNLLKFDEIDDVFDDFSPVFGRSTGQSRKAWVNHMLEQNQVPAIWIANHVRALDPAFVRRFDVVIEMPVPPLAVRQSIIQDCAVGALSDEAIKRFSDSEYLSPAVIARASKVVNAVRADWKPEKISQAVENLVNSTLEAQGFPKLVTTLFNKAGPLYDPKLVNTDIDLTPLLAGLRKAKGARVFFYGIPGSGKTAFGYWIATSLGKPYISKHASDLISKYVGETERNIARAFKEAADSGAVLQIDEVDSFLQDRQFAERSWEISHVNEMLTQMESFPGLFFASTNALAPLDPATMRRFDLKVRFDALTPEQVELLFTRVCAHLELKGEAVPSAAAKIMGVTPGDFATIIRRHNFMPLKHANDLVSALAAECTMKRASRTSMGFLK